MVPEVKALWLKALRSGEFKQGTGKLRIINELSTAPDKYDEKFCCLGVLCAVTHLGYFDHDIFVMNHDPDGETREDYYTGEGELPKPMLTKFQIEDKQQTHLIHLNDGWEGNELEPEMRKHTFLEIADWIEENL